MEEQLQHKFCSNQDQGTEGKKQTCIELFYTE